MDCALNFNLTSENVKTIKGVNQSITIVKSTVQASQEQPVAWIAFPPMESISVTWTEDYFIYASDTAIDAGATIKESSITDDPVETTQLYTFDGGTFKAGPGGESAAFDAFNSGAQTYTLGLAQVAKINNKPVAAPISASSVLSNENVSFQPRVKISVFLSATTDNGVVLSKIQGAVYEFELSLSNTSIALVFDETHNKFMKDPNSKKTASMLMQIARKHRHMHA